MAAAFVGINPYLGLFGGSIVVGVGMGQLGKSSGRSRDVAIGTVMAWILGLGALFLGLYLSSPVANTNIAIGVGVLFGSIFGVDAHTAWIIAGVGAATSLALLAMARPLLFASIDPEVAMARGLRVRLLDALFLILLGITVAEAVPAVGALLVFALLVTPAASIRKMVKRPFLDLALSALLALLITWAGLTISFYLSYPVSFDISMLGFVIYLVALSFLEGVTSLFVLLWFVLLPRLLFKADQVAALVRPIAPVIFVSILSVLGLITVGGLWDCRAWAFRLGLTLAVCSIALAISWLAISFSFAFFELGLLLVLALNSILLFFFLQPTVARAMVSKEQHGRDEH